MILIENQIVVRRYDDGCLYLKKRFSANHHYVLYSVDDLLEKGWAKHNIILAHEYKIPTLENLSEKEKVKLVQLKFQIK